jgi:hypothetical protein
MRCKAITQKGTQCQNNALKGGHCSLHKKMAKKSYCGMSYAPPKKSYCGCGK